MVATRRQVELLEKNKPRQDRAKRTYEAILEAAAELLVEVGVERISTNLTAERAGITVPAGFSFDLPLGVSFIGGAFAEHDLIRIAYAYEQATKVRRAPKPER